MQKISHVTQTQMNTKQYLQLRTVEIYLHLRKFKVNDIKFPTDPAIVLH